MADIKGCQVENGIEHGDDQCKDHVHKCVKIDEILLGRFGDITTLISRNRNKCEFKRS